MGTSDTAMLRILEQRRELVLDFITANPPLDITVSPAPDEPTHT